MAKRNGAVHKHVQEEQDIGGSFTRVWGLKFDNPRKHDEQWHRQYGQIECCPHSDSGYRNLRRDIRDGQGQQDVEANDWKALRHKYGIGAGP